MDKVADALSTRSFTIKLWPPSQKTRLMLVERMTKNLSSVSIFSKKYGLLTPEEAEENAKQIEDVAFAAANEHHEKEPDGDGSSAVQLYAKESSKLMLEVLKRGPKGSKDTQGPEVPRSIDNGVPRKTVFDISGGSRAFIDGSEAQELLSPLAETGNSYTKICFSNRSFGVDAARVAEPILRSLRGQLTEVDLSDFIAGRPETDALEVMSIFSSSLEGCLLRYLDLSNNALGEKGVRAFGALLQSQRDLEELYFMNNGISEEAAQAIRELLPSTDKLKVLHFHNNMTGDDGAVSLSEIVQSSAALEDFRCSSTRVGSDGGIALANALSACKNIKKLDLRDNMFGVEAGVALSKSVSVHANLAELYLSYLNLEDEGTIAISNALKGSTSTLRVLELAGNEITVKSAGSLAACVATNQSLEKLNLSENELKDEGCLVLCKALEGGHDNLKELDLSSNSIRRVGAKVSAQAVANKPGFALLNIDGNFISEEGIDEVKDILKAGSNSISVLGPLDENDPEGGDEDEEEEESSKAAEDGEAEAGEELESKLQDLKVEQ
ncbi:RAN GTPase-activating protein 1-like [Nymphaea colorata]|nr:RAN GTPase-activating protein 1-like [Nymphaea colorata]